MDVKNPSMTFLQSKLTDRLQKGQALDVTHRAANLANNDVHILGRDFFDRRLDLVGDVGHDLDGGAQVRTFALLGDHLVVDLASGVVGILIRAALREAFVVTKVEVGFGAIFGDINLAMLIRTHRPGIKIDIGIKLLNTNLQSVALQKESDGCGGQSLTERRDDSSSDKNVLRVVHSGLGILFRHVSGYHVRSPFSSWSSLGLFTQSILDRTIIFQTHYLNAPFSCNATKCRYSSGVSIPRYSCWV